MSDLTRAKNKTTSTMLQVGGAVPSEYNASYCHMDFKSICPYCLVSKEHTATRMKVLQCISVQIYNPPETTA